MKRIHEVILDVDDVLNKFCMAAMHEVGVGGHRLDYVDYPAECGWDIVKAANVMQHKGLCPFTPETFWEALDQRFWATVPCVVYLDHLLDYLVDRVGRDNITIATSPTLSPLCVAGKLEWIHSFLPKWLHRQYMIGPCKHLLANPHALLIDDHRGNCEKFLNRGGHILLVHKPWNYTPSRTHSREDWDHLTLVSLQHGLHENFGKEFKV